MKNRTITKTALTLSVLLLIMWSAFGAGTSVAWFSDTTPVQRNSFIIGELDLSVYHKVGDTYKTVEKDTKLFDDNALYEPGYVQVVKLKIENSGNVDFDYKLSIDVDKPSVVLGINEEGQSIYLPDFLKFGVIFSDTETDLDRDTAKLLAQLDAAIALEDYTEIRSLNSNSTEDNAEYAALILYMPEEVGNVANYRGDAIPRIELGLTVLASQKGTLF